MIYEQVELHNVDEAVRSEDKPGVLLQRLPQKVMALIRPETAGAYLNAACCEIRFAADGPVKLTLSSEGGDMPAYTYAGSFPTGSILVKSEPGEFTIGLPSPGFLADPAFDASGHPFSPRINRVLFPSGRIRLHGVEGRSVRPPQPGEVPALRYLAYGTSITQGIAATHPGMAYAMQTAGRLGADLINLGVSGNAFCEEALGHYFAEREDWDFATLCISVNMLNRGVPAAEFGEAAERMLRIMAARRPDKPIVAIGLLPCFFDVGLRWPDRVYRATSDEYRATLKRIVADIGSPNVRYIDGRELMDGLRGMTHDLLHPGDEGMIEIGRRLAAFVEPLLAERGLRHA